MDDTALSFLPYIPQIYIRALCTTKTLPTIYEHMPPTPVLQTKALGLCGEDPALEIVMQTAEWTSCCNMHICTNVFYGCNQKHSLTQLGLALRLPRMPLERSLPVFQCWYKTKHLFLNRWVAPRSYIITLSSDYRRRLEWDLILNNYGKVRKLLHPRFFLWITC